jgi:site-specific DNA recombinase
MKNEKKALIGGTKRFVALARVSSREQEREGFSLDVQESALKAYADRAGGQIVKLYRIAETASKTDERKTFKELLRYVKENAATIDGLLFYKVDRAARNLFDYVELERLETDYNIPFISVSQPTETTPAGRMQRRMLASMASFYTEQQSLDVREGLSRRVQSGLFVGLAPYGYENKRVEGRSIVVLNEQKAQNVRLILDLYAYQNCTIDGVVQRLADDGIKYSDDAPGWCRAKVHNILRDRAYIGEVRYRDQWYPGSQSPIVARHVWDRVQALLGEQTYKAHELTYAGGMIRCGHCGNLITGESVVKKQSGKEYVYYRCTMYKSPGHPHIRLTEAELDEQIIRVFNLIRQDDPIREWFPDMLRLWAQDKQRQSRQNTEQVQRDLTLLREQQDRLLNLRLLGEIEADTFARKNTEFRDRIANLTVKLEAAARSRDELTDVALKVFELSQALADRWLTADYSTKRQWLEMVFSNFRLDGATLVYEMNKPFDALVEGLIVQSSRGDRI